jgi:hypothetical protein
LIILVLAIAIVPAVLLSSRKAQSFRRPSVVSGCPEWVLEQINTAEKVHPEHLVVNPLQGRHKVYGVFKVPEGYQPSPYFVVQVDGATPYCGAAVISKRNETEQTVIGRFRTRTTLWMMTKGKIEELSQPQNWSLMIVKQPQTGENQNPS